MIQMKPSVTYEWEVLRLPDIVVVDSHEDDPVRKVKWVNFLYKLLRSHMHKIYPIRLEN
jgi:hypothetical protein